MKIVYFLIVTIIIVNSNDGMAQNNYQSNSKKTILKFEELKDNDTSKHRNAKITVNGMEIIPAGAAEDQWYEDGEGSFFYKEVSGDFLLETEVSIFRFDRTNKLPKAHFSSAGLLIKKPTYTTGNAIWLMYNVGFQAGFWGREFKVTRGSSELKDDLDAQESVSLSTLKLIPSEYKEYTKLRLARVGDEYRAYYQDNNDDWLESKAQEVTVTYGSGKSYPIENFDDVVLRPTGFGLKDMVQVGVITNPGMNPDSKNFHDISIRDSGARFKYLWIQKIDSFKEAFVKN